MKRYVALAILSGLAMTAKCARLWASDSLIDANDGGSALIDDWSVEVHCDGFCMDLNGSFSVDEEDFLLVVVFCGWPVDLPQEGVGSLWCLDGAFSSDGYIDPFDLSSWDWTLSNFDRTYMCFEPLPLVAGGQADLNVSVEAPAVSSCSSSPTAGDSLSELMILGKGQLSAVLTDGLYMFDRDAMYLGNDLRADLPDRCNMRLVCDPMENLYAVNSERGVLRIDDLVEVVIPPGRSLYLNDPRYLREAVVYVGIQGEDANPFGRPILDVAFDPNGYAYVVPVVVQPNGEAAYVAAAKLALQEGADPSYEVVQLYDDPPAADDNQDLNHLREIEVDGAGNVYAVNACSLDESDILWKYGSDGTLLGRVALTEPNTPAPVADPLALHVSADGQILYLASGQRHQADANGVTIYGFSTAELQYYDSVTIQRMHCVTGITEDPATGTLYVVGFTLGEIPPYPGPFAPPFYEPCLAQIEADADAVEAVPLSNPGLHDLALPTSIAWVGGD